MYRNLYSNMHVIRIYTSTLFLSHTNKTNYDTYWISIWRSLSEFLNRISVCRWVNYYLIFPFCLILTDFVRTDLTPFTLCEWIVNVGFHPHLSSNDYAQDVPLAVPSPAQKGTGRLLVSALFSRKCNLDNSVKQGNSLFATIWSRRMSYNWIMTKWSQVRWWNDGFYTHTVPRLNNGTPIFPVTIASSGVGIQLSSHTHNKSTYVLRIPVRTLNMGVTERHSDKYFRCHSLQVKMTQCIRWYNSWDKFQATSA